MNGKLNEDQICFLNKCLDEYGINVKWVGRQYIKDSDEAISFDNSLLVSLDTQVYPNIAKKYKTRPVNIEKSIRNAILKSTYTDQKGISNKTLILDLVERLRLFSNEKRKGKLTK